LIWCVRRQEINQSVEVCETRRGGRRKANNAGFNGGNLYLRPTRSHVMSKAYKYPFAVACLFFCCVCRLVVQLSNRLGIKARPQKHNPLPTSNEFLEAMLYALAGTTPILNPAIQVKGLDADKIFLRPSGTIAFHPDVNTVPVIPQSMTRCRHLVITRAD
jgi:hypothetical protein